MGNTLIDRYSYFEISKRIAEVERCSFSATRMVPDEEGEWVRVQDIDDALMFLSYEKGLTSND